LDVTFTADKMKYIVGNRRANLIRGMKVNLMGGGGANLKRG
jgi:hypothetical protein